MFIVKIKWLSGEDEGTVDLLAREQALTPSVFEIGSTWSNVKGRYEVLAVTEYIKLSEAKQAAQDIAEHYEAQLVKLEVPSLNDNPQLWYEARKGDKFMIDGLLFVAEQAYSGERLYLTTAESLDRVSAMSSEERNEAQYPWVHVRVGHAAVCSAFDMVEALHEGTYKIS